MKKVAIIGGGAAGCFCAVLVKQLRPDYDVSVYETAAKPMAKLAITGGGRCNLTNSFACVTGSEEQPATVPYRDNMFIPASRAGDLSLVYPRGARFMKKVLSHFDQNDCCTWFEKEGVRLVVQPDQCVFPASQDAMQIVHLLERLMRQSGVDVRCGAKVSALEPDLTIRFRDGSSVQADSVVVCSGGASARILEPCRLKTEASVPSLFTFKIDDAALRELMGTVVESVNLSLAGTKFKSSGTLLLTDWGVSGPATLKLSSYGARWLAGNQYRCELIINWLASNERSTLSELGSLAKANPQKQLSSIHPSALTERLWRHLLRRAALREDCRWAEIGSKGMARLAGVLCSDIYSIIGRARFKEEFVTCGGVALSEVDPSTMACRIIPGLYLAGEVLDIDAITGGFNLQAAWSTAHLAATSLCQE